MDEIKKNIKINKIKSASVKLYDWCLLSSDENDFMEVVKWSNGDGYDVYINKNNNKIYEETRFHLTNGQFRALKKMIKEIDKKDE